MSLKSSLSNPKTSMQGVLGQIEITLAEIGGIAVFETSNSLSATTQQQTSKSKQQH